MNFNTIFDKLLTTAPVNKLDEAEQFVNEVHFMCREFLKESPILLYKDVPLTKNPSFFFRCKVRHRANTGDHSKIFETIAGDRFAYQRGLDISTTRSSIEEECIVFLPDGYKVFHSPVNYSNLMEATEHASCTDLVRLNYSSNLANISESTQHAFVTSVPFYYCIRVTNSSS